jgi:long-chain acyl-CoA synthetase
MPLRHSYTIGYGSVGTFVPTAPKMLHPNQKGDAQALCPDILVAAPAVLDKVYANVKAKFAVAKGLPKYLIESGLASGLSNFNSGSWGSSGCIAPLLFKKKVATLLGGKVKIIVTGSAPLGVEVQKFVQTVFACPVRQGYGLTETCAGTCITKWDDNSESVVGPPQECACIRLRDWEEGNYRNSDMNDPAIGMVSAPRAMHHPYPCAMQNRRSTLCGPPACPSCLARLRRCVCGVCVQRRGEVLIGGPMVCSGYLENPAMPDADVAAKNREDFVTIDGIRYFCTGDVGQFTKSGNLQIIDRKKDLVKLQQGEYVALSKVENAMKGSKFVALPMTYARSTMKYCIALICPMEPALRTLDCAPEGASLKELCSNEQVAAAVLADIAAACKKAKLTSFEIPNKVILIDELWTPDNDMLTAVNKLKRKDIEKKHLDQISSVYV